MHTTRKFATGAHRPHAASVDTDPASSDLILVQPAGFRCPCSGMPTWRKRCAIAHPSAPLPL